jgi:hypothetical protein
MRVTDPYVADEVARQSALLILDEELDWSLLDIWEDGEQAVMRV